MNTEELAFVNRQLAGMLKSGIPLEAGLKKMTKSMSSGRLKDQLGQLGSRLEKGQAVEQAVDGLDLPDTYKRLLVLGQESQSMPKVLCCVADYYERIGTLVTRLRGLAIYPMLILVCGLLVAGLMAFLLSMLKDDVALLTEEFADGLAFSKFFRSSWAYSKYFYRFEKQLTKVLFGKNDSINTNKNNNIISLTRYSSINFINLKSRKKHIIQIRIFQ